MRSRATARRMLAVFRRPTGSSLLRWTLELSSVRQHHSSRKGWVTEQVTSTSIQVSTARCGRLQRAETFEPRSPGCFSLMRQWPSSVKSMVLALRGHRPSRSPSRVSSESLEGGGDVGYFPFRSLGAVATRRDTRIERFLTDRRLLRRRLRCWICNRCRTRCSIGDVGV